MLETKPKQTCDNSPDEDSTSQRENSGDRCAPMTRRWIRALLIVVGVLVLLATLLPLTLFFLFTSGQPLALPQTKRNAGRLRRPDAPMARVSGCYQDRRADSAVQILCAGFEHIRRNDAAAAVLRLWDVRRE